MPVVGYSAGTAFMQVVPSFRDIEGALQKEAEKIGRQVDAAISKSVPQALRKASGKAADEGKRAGQEYGGAFQRSVRRHLDTAFKGFGPIVVDANTSRADQAIAQLRHDLKQLHDAKIGIDPDDADFVAEVARMRAIAESLERNGVTIAVRSNAREVAAELKSIQDLVTRDAAAAGERAGQRYAGAFEQSAGRRMRAALAAFSQTDIELRVNPSELDKALADAHKQIKRLSEVDIHARIPASEYLDDVRALETELKRIEDNTVDVRVKANVRQALAEIKALREFADGTGGDSRRRGSQQGEEYGGAYAAAVRRTLRAGLAALGEHTQPEIAALRKELESLDTRIGVDLDATAASARIAEIGLRLRQLAHTEVDIEVNSNLRAAAAEIDHMQDRLDQLGDGGSADRVRQLADAANYSMSRLGLMISVGASIGTVIVPAAAAAAVAVSGIATAAAAVVLGVGVLGLGLSGIGKAVGALDKFQKDADKSAVSLSGAENRVANALSSVQSAQRSLARAERERRQAVADLVKAQESARRQLEDMTSSLKSNSLAQRQSKLDIAEAKKELDKILANPKASEAEREQARITYEERVLQLDDLQVKGARLAADKAVADRKGIADSDDVRAAQERIADATDAVISASDSLTQAQRSMGQAFEKTGVAGGEALDNLHESMDELSPAGQRFAQFIFGLKGDFKALKAEAEGGLLPGVEQSIRNVLPFMPQLQRLVRLVGVELGDGFEDVTAQLNDPVWQRFFGYIGQTAVPTLRGMFTITSNVARGIAAIVVALSPFNADMGKGLVDASENFARWSESLRNSSGLQKFLAYVKETGPQVVDVIKQIATFVAHVVIAAAPVGSVVLKVFDALLGVLNRIPIPLLTAFVAVLAGMAAVMLTGAAATSIRVLAANLLNIAVKISTGTQTAYNVALTQYQAAATAATVRTGALGAAMSAAAGGAAVARVGVSALVGLLGGPLGIAVIAATVAIGAFIAAQAKVDEQSRATIDALGRIASAFESGGDAAVLSLARQDTEVANMIVEMSKYGVTARDAFRASTGDIEAQKMVIGRLRGELAILQNQQNDFMKGKSPADLSLLGGKGDDAAAKMKEIDLLKAKIKELQDRYETANKAAAAYGETTDEIGDAQRRASASSSVYGQQISDLEQVYTLLTSKTLDATQASDLFRKFTDTATKTAISATEAEEAHARSLVDLRKSLAENGTELDLSKARNDEHRLSILASRDALEDALRTAREKTLADIAAKVSLEDATRANDERIAAILAEIPATQRNSVVVQELVDRYGRIPSDVTTQIKTNGAEAVLQQLKDLKVAQYALEKNLTIAAARAALAGQLSQFESQVPAQARAAGGPITGPGGPTDDKIPAWLSNGEYVIPAGIVGQYGLGFFDQLIGRRGFARGGPVQTWPFTVDTSQTKMPFTLEDLQKQFANPGAQGPGFPPWPSSPAAQRGDTGVWRSIMGLVAGSGIPYSFGNSYRAGDPLWHGSGRAVDLMGYNQDRLGQFFMDMRPRVLELIHTTNTAGYYVSRGQRRSSMGDQDELHRNHLHIAMDEGGMLEPGWNPPIWNGTGRPEPVLNPAQWDAVMAGVRGGDDKPGNTYNFEFRDTSLDASKLRALQDREAVYHRIGRPR